jgi:DNA polymerase-3 subunit alpha
MASLLNADSGDVERISFLVNEAQQNKIPILPPDVNKSFVRFTPEDHGIRFGLEAIKNVGEQITINIIEERVARGPFKDFNEFLRRIQHKDLNKKSLESLIKGGVFDSLGVERNQALFNIEDIVKFNSLNRKASQPNGMGSLFGAATPQAELTLKPAPPTDPQERLTWEKELLGFYLSDHPLNAFKEKFEKAQVKPISDALQVKSESTTLRIGGLITRIQKIITKTGQPMLFANIEDFSPTPIEVVVFNSTYATTANEWELNRVIIVEGHISLRNGETKFIAEKARKQGTISGGVSPQKA